MANAQAEYFSQTHDGSHVRQYAQKFIADEGKQNGLYWKPADENQPESPLGPLAADAGADGYIGKTQTPQPFHGYLSGSLQNKATMPTVEQRTTS